MVRLSALRTGRLYLKEIFLIPICVKAAGGNVNKIIVISISKSPFMASIAKLYESSVVRAESIEDLGVLIDSKL
jgi:hypothetical protein